MMWADPTVLKVRNLSKTFTLHQQQGVQIAALKQVNLTLQAGECLVVRGPSGAGKSSLLRTLYGNYLASSGEIWLQHQGQWLDLCQLTAREVLALRQSTLGYVSQFLRVVPRVPALRIVAQPLLERGVAEASALQQARTLLKRLAIPERLWSLAPATFSGGEQQRVNIAQGFIAPYPLLLLDEPTASLDELNRAVVIDLIQQKKAQGVAIIGIFHDQSVREAVADRYIDLEGLNQSA